MTDNTLENWISLAKKILASILIDHGAVFPVIEIIQSNAHWFPPKERVVWRAILACLDEDEMIPPTVEAVSARLVGDVSPAYVQHLAGQFSEHDNSLLIYNTEQLRDIGVMVAVREIGKKMAGVGKVEEVEKVVSEAATELTGVWANRSERQPGAFAVSRSAWKEVEAFNGAGIQTGLTWFDQLTGGLWPGMNYWIVAPYKAGKSTVMRNIVLNAARLGQPVGVYCAEGSRELFALGCQAMLATEILLDSGVKLQHCRLSTTLLRQTWNKGGLRADEVKAVEQAREIWERLPVRVYDSMDNIRDMVTMRYLIKRDKTQHGVKVVWADYSQLFGTGKTLFERQSGTSLKVQEIAAGEGVAFGMLAQKNEEGVRSAGDGYSPNVKGGGDAAAAADYMMIPSLDKDQPDILTITLKLSRHTETGKHSHVINRSSGLILDKWFKTGTVDLND